VTTLLPDLTPDRLAAAGRRVMARCDELARVSASIEGIERVYLSPEHARVNRLVAQWMREIGMTPRQDAAGNLWGRLGAKDGSRADPAGEGPALVLGSHLDTVPDAGRYDGIAGVLMALEVARLLRAPDPGLTPRAALPFALEVVAFSDEEGTRFGKALLGSSAVAGTWDEDWWALTDEDGTPLRQAFLEFGLDPARIGEAARRPEEVVAYLEAHIEQGPQLDRRGESRGIVFS
jgi:allantoate deiminase